MTANSALPHRAEVSEDLLAAAQASLKRWPTDGPNERLASALLLCVLAETTLVAAIGDAAGTMGGLLGAVWGARCNPEPATPTFQMTDMSWYDDASISSQGKTSGWRKVTVRVVRFAGVYILCPWSDVQLRIRLDVADIANSIRTWTAMAQQSVDNGAFSDLASALQSFGMEHLGQAGFYAHERMHVSAVRGHLQRDRSGGELRTILNEAAAFASTKETDAQAKAAEIGRRLENRIDGIILASFTHSDAPGDPRPPSGMPTAPLPSETMPASVTGQAWGADEQALTANGYTRVS